MYQKCIAKSLANPGKLVAKIALVALQKRNLESLPKYKWVLKFLEATVEKSEENQYGSWGYRPSEVP